MKSEGGNVFMRTMQRKGLGSVLPPDLIEKIRNPLLVSGISSDLGHGYEGPFLIDVCGAILDADKDKKLDKSQKFLAVHSSIIIRAAAKLGIIALIDDATGFISDKRREAYRALFQEFLAEEVRAYQKEFPKDLFDMMYRLYGLRRIPGMKNNPRFFAGFIRKYVYEPLANSNGAILEVLDDRNPVVYVNGGRRYKMFSFLSERVGLEALRRHLWQIIGIGSAVTTKAQFERGFKNAFPSTKGQLEFPYHDIDPFGGVESE